LKVDPDLQKAIQESLKVDLTQTSSNSLDAFINDMGSPKYQEDPTKPIELRGPTQPPGLKNVGNTCFVNSLFQTYFTLPPFVSGILQNSGNDSKCRNTVING
jgi:ubiquitin C-terminal hydrolase